MSLLPARWLTSVATAALCSSGVLAAVTLERHSVEHANRLQRGGELAAAARAYGDRIGSDTSALALRYNFGTTLLDLGSGAAPRELSRASAGEDEALRAHALYNIGLWNLRRARDVVASDSTRAYAQASADANKAALRLEPGRSDARWNLALAQRLIDSVNADGGRAGTEAVDGTDASDDQVLSEELREFEDASAVDSAPRQGSDEALAQTEEATTLRPGEAEAILVTDPDRSAMVRKLLNYQGRMQRRPFGRPAGRRW